MNKRWLLNGALALLVVFLILVALNEPGNLTPAAPSKLTPFAVAQVTHITVIRPGFADIQVQRAAGHWQLVRTANGAGTAEPPLPGNAFRIDSIAQLAQADSQLQLHPNATGLTQYGLASPPVSVRLNDIEIAFGNTDPIKGWRYVRIGETVHAIADDQFSQVMADFHDFVSAELMLEQPVIQSLRLPNLMITRSTAGAWKTEPQPADYSADAVTKLVDEWRYARALSVGPLEPGPPQGQVVVETKQGKKLSFDILAYAPQLLLRNSELGLTYRFAADVGARLFDLDKHKNRE